MYVGARVSVSASANVWEWIRVREWGGMRGKRLVSKMHMKSWYNLRRMHGKGEENNGNA